MTTSVQRAIRDRRSRYVISADSPISDEELVRAVTHCVKHTPSMFNMQSTRAIVLLGEHHRYLWDLITDSLGPEILAKRPNVAHEHFEKVEDKVNNLKGGHGTVLFFEDSAAVDRTKERYPAYARNFETWSLQSAAIAQYAVWLAFTEAAPTLGLTLQHYYPDMEAVRSRWGIPDSWKMTGQMPFGTVVDPPADKEFIDEVELVQVFA